MSMFCYQCEQTAKGTGCTVQGVCGKKETTAGLQDRLTGELIGLARAAQNIKPTIQTHKAILDGLFTTVTNVNFDDSAILQTIEAVQAAKQGLLDQDVQGATKAPCDPYDITQIWELDEDVRALKSFLLFSMRGMGAYAHHALLLGRVDEDLMAFFYKGLRALGEERSYDEMLQLVMEHGQANLRCMALLEEANTGTYGKPVPTKVSCNIEPGPFIVISGHDLHDLKLLLEQTQGTGVNVYTHGEMLPAHGYPELHKYPQLKGNFGTAWHNQQKEFTDIPAPILFTTNCLKPPKPSYADRVFTSELVGFPEMTHIGDDKDFTPLIDKAKELGGYPELHKMTGINGGDVLTTGFAKDSILAVSDKVIQAVKSGAIKHFFLVGGCDAWESQRAYYTDFVKQTPKDTVILTLGCTKYRFNDLDLGQIGDLPRIMDMGQCNDAYGAIQVALALAAAFECGVNELPLTLVVAWFEQKAEAVLTTLLSLGLKNLYLGPKLPAFISASPHTVDALAKQFNVTLISTPQEDLKKILG